MVIAIVVFAVVWLVSGVFAYAANFAHFQREYPQLSKRDYAVDRGKSITWGLGGPISLFVELQTSGFKHGLKWR